MSDNEPRSFPDKRQFADEEARRIIDEAVLASTAETTAVQYGYRYRRFKRYCEERGFSPCPAESAVVTSYLAFRSTQTKPRCVALDRAAIRHYHRVNDHSDPGATQQTSLLMAGIKRIHGTETSKKTALPTTAIREMCLNLDVEGGALAMRNKAAILMGYAGAFRADELKNLNVGDLDFQCEGVVITVGKSKTDQERQGQHVAIANGEHPETDPVLAIKEWLEVYPKLLGRELAKSDPVFPALKRVGDPIERKVWLRETRMTMTCYRKVLKEQAEKFGLDPKDVSGHSCRRGHATQAARNGAHRADIAKQGRWRSTQVMDGYIAEGRRFEDNSSRHLGL